MRSGPFDRSRHAINIREDMGANPIIDEIYRTNFVRDALGNKYDLFLGCYSSPYSSPDPSSRYS